MLKWLREEQVKDVLRMRKTGGRMGSRRSKKEGRGASILKFKFRILNFRCEILKLKIGILTLSCLLQNASQLQGGGHAEESADPKTMESQKPKYRI